MVYTSLQSVVFFRKFTNFCKLLVYVKFKIINTNHNNTQTLQASHKGITAQSYKTYVRPIFWVHTNINQLEAEQRQAAWFGKGDYKTSSSTTAMMADLSWQHYSITASMPSLWLSARITHNFIAIPAAQYFYLLTIGGHGYGHRFYVPFCDYMKFSFVPSAIRLWNQLLNHSS